MLFFQFYVNGTKVVEGNIPCTNGIIHRVEAPFTLRAPKQTVAPTSSVSLTPVLVPIVTLVVIAIIIFVVVVIYKKARQGYWNLLQTWLARRQVYLYRVNICDNSGALMC